MFVNRHNIILASGSPRRQLFLKELGLEFSICIAENIEPQPQVNELPEDYALRAALAKGQHVAINSVQDALVVAADTVVSVDGLILGKPKDSVEALQMLKMLAGKKHTVISAVCIIFPPLVHGEAREELCFYDKTEVVFHAWDEKVLASYAACGEPLDKAGAYAIQGHGAFLVKHIKGSWSNVVGLPVTLLVDILLKRGFITTG